jgi:hypothetical protein
MVADPTPIIWVRSTRRDARVCLWERDPRHPGGEAYVAASQGVPDGFGTAQIENLPVQVARTPAVQAAIAAQDIVEVPEGEALAAIGARGERIDAERALATQPQFAVVQGGQGDHPIKLHERLQRLEDSRRNEQEANKALADAIATGVKAGVQEVLSADRIGARTLEERLASGEIDEWQSRQVAPGPDQDAARRATPPKAAAVANAPNQEAQSTEAQTGLVNAPAEEVDQPPTEANQGEASALANAPPPPERATRTRRQEAAP